MNCKQTQASLSAYQDKELSPLDASAVKAHLDDCRACQDELQQISRAWEMLSSLGTIEPSPNFKARFWEKVRREEAKPGLWDWMAWPQLVPTLAGAMALWILGITGGMFLYENHASQSAEGSRTALKVFTSPYPPNSIEKIYLQGTATPRESRRGL